MLILDNLGGDPALGGTRVLELDPITQQLVWRYEGASEQPLQTRVMGACHRLPNGNTLIVETAKGRALEVTMEGEIVWEYVNPHRAINGSDLIAVLNEVVRIEASVAAPWLEH
jgi:hypothetical protein